MYGQKKLNSHYILSYGLTKEFFDGYKGLRHSKLEIPPILTRRFHVYIKPWVIKNRVRSRSVQSMMKKHRMTTTKQAQDALSRSPTTRRNLSQFSHRKTILIHAKLIDFALDKLRKKNVILILGSIHDEKMLDGKKIPSHFQTFRLFRAMKKEKLSTKTIHYIRQFIEAKKKDHAKHFIFGSDDFNSWLFSRAIHAAKLIQILDTLIRKKPIGLILDLSEITSPGNTLSLLAKKYGLPFVLMPQVLVSDFNFLPSHASYYFVWGSYMKKWMEERGIPSRKIKITGSLRFQYAHNETHLTSKYYSLRSIPPLWMKKPKGIVTYFSQTYDQTVSANIMKWIIATARKLPHIHFLIKPHPSDGFDYRFYTKTKNIDQLPINTNLYQVIDQSDLIMTISSNTALEAASLNKCIIVLQPVIPYHFDRNNNDYHAHLVRAAAGPVANNEEDLTCHVRCYFKDNLFRQQAIEQAQHFLKHSLQTSCKPADVAYKFVQNILKKQGRA